MSEGIIKFVVCLFSFFSFTVFSEKLEAMQVLHIECHDYYQHLSNMKKNVDGSQMAFVAKRNYKSQGTHTLGEMYGLKVADSERSLDCLGIHTPADIQIKPKNMYVLRSESDDFENHFQSLKDTGFNFELAPDGSAVIDDKRNLIWLTQLQLENYLQVTPGCILHEVGASDSVPFFRMTPDSKWIYFAEFKNKNEIVVDTNTSYYGAYESYEFKAISLEELCSSERTKNGDYKKIFNTQQHRDDSSKTVNLSTNNGDGRFLEKVEIDAISVDGNKLQFIYVSQLESSTSINTDILLNEVIFKDGQYSLKLQNAVSISDRSPLIDGKDTKPKFSPTKQFISFVRMDDPVGESASNSIQLVAFDGENLFHREKVNVDIALDEKINIKVENRIIDYHWSCAGNCLFVMVEERGVSVIYEIKTSDNWATHTILEPLELKAYSYEFLEFRNGLALAVLESSLIEPPSFKIYRRASDGDKFSPTTEGCGLKSEIIDCSLNINHSYIEALGEFPKIEELDINTSFGNIHTFVVYPPGHAKENKLYPSIVMIHGGPTDSWKNKYDPLINAWARAGYVVILPNLPGSTGYGIDFSNMSKNGWSSTIYESLQETVESLLNEQLYPSFSLDPNNMAIMGSSFGGYMVALVATQGLKVENFPDFKFKAGIFVNGIFDLKSWARTTDQLWYPADQLGFTPSSDRLSVSIDPSSMSSKLAENAPPMLLIVGDRDKRVSPAQAFAFHRSLVDSCVPARLVVLDGEAHGFKPKAHPKVQASVLTWLSQYMEGGRGFVKHETTKVFGKREFENIGKKLNSPTVISKYHLRAECN